MPGVTRQVSAFRIVSNPPLYLVDTPGVMVPRVEKVTAGLCLALTRAVPDSALPPDVLVGFMLRVVRSRRLSGSASKKSRSAPFAPASTSAAGSSPRAAVISMNVTHWFPETRFDMADKCPCPSLSSSSSPILRVRGGYHSGRKPRNVVGLRHIWSSPFAIVSSVSLCPLPTRPLRFRYCDRRP